MKLLKKSIGLSVFTIIFSLLVVEKTEAVPNPSSIQWTAASPSAFVTSLYVGVLGRSPGSADNVSGWAAQVTSNPNSRLTVFNRFLSTPEYRRSRWARQKREYTIYYQKTRTGTIWSIAKSNRDARRTGYSGPYTYGVAAAKAGFYRAFYSR